MLFQEMNSHLLWDQAPSKFLNKISRDPDFEAFPFSMLLRLKKTKQTPKHHPEGNVWNHTMMVVDEAAKRKSAATNPRVFMWAALLHDIGKPSTTKIRRGKITSYDHDKAGAALSLRFLSALDSDEAFIAGVTALVRWHMQILFVVKDMPFADIPAMRSETDIRDVALLGLCDRLGRKGVDVRAERENIRMFLNRLDLPEMEP